MPVVLSSRSSVSELAGPRAWTGKAPFPSVHNRQYIRDLIAEPAKTGAIRNDVAPDELATFCLHAIGAASDPTSKAAVRRLVTIILAGLRPAEN